MFQNRFFNAEIISSSAYELFLSDEIMSEENIDARAAQGFVNHPKGSVDQQWGNRTDTRTEGGDYAGRDIINVFLNGRETTVQTDTTILGLLLDQIVQIGKRDRIEAAQQTALPRDSELFRPRATSNPQILEQLKEFNRLREFLVSLIQDRDIPEALQEKLKTELATHASTAEHNPQHSDSIQPTTAQQNKKQSDISHLNPYLMVVLRPAFAVDKFLITAWLVPADSEIDAVRRFVPLDLNSEKKGSDCSLAEVPMIIDRFLAESRQKLRGRFFNPITVEIFLPIEYLATDIDRWEVTARRKAISLRQKHPVILRSYERLCFDYLDYCWTDWNNAWNRMKPHLSKTSTHEIFETIDEFEDCNWDAIPLQFQSQTQKVGFIIPCLPDAVGQKNLFNVLLDASAPVAIWLRKEVSGGDQIHELHKLIKGGSLATLPERLRDARKQAFIDGRSRDEHFSYHLSILWEDPTRLTPDVLFELQPPQAPGA